MDFTKINDNSVDCMVSFLPDNPDIEILRDCIRVLMHGAFAFFVSSVQQDISCKIILKMEDVGFETDFSSYSWVSKGEGGRLKTKMVIVAMKPLSEKTYVDQALANGHGITWLDDCRIPAGDGDIEHGRFPANILVSDDALNDGKIYRSKDYGDVGSFSKYFDLDAWYKAKFETDDAPKEDRLREYFKTMGSREGDVVLDPFNDAYNDEAVIKQLEADHANRLKLETKDLDGWL